MFHARSPFFTLRKYIYTDLKTKHLRKECSKTPFREC